MKMPQNQPTTPAQRRQSPGSATDALGALLTATESEFKRGAVGATDPDVSFAFALGWQMAELYRPGRRSSSRIADSHDLPGVSSLTADELTQLGTSQLSAGLAKLAKPLQDAGLEPPDANAFAESLSGLSATARQEEIRKFHVEILAVLTAADFRLGKAYGLGRALADTTRAPPNPSAELGRYRVATVSQWIRELATTLPPHAAHPVADSLEAWSRFYDRDNERQVDDSEIKGKLPAQGRLWRSLLSGEKNGTDVLEIADYLGAGEGMIGRSVGIAWRLLKRYWWVVLLALLLFLLGIWALASSAASIVKAVGASSILASIGLSWKGIGTSLGTAAAKVEQPLWGAQLDQAIYRRITPDPVLAEQPKRALTDDEPSLVASDPPTAPA